MYGVIAIIFAISLLSWSLINNISTINAVAEIYQDGNLIRTFYLSDDMIYYYNPVSIEIKNNALRVTHALECPNKICVNTGFISNSIIPIICVPNRLEIRITGGKNSNEIDAITR